MRRLTAFPVSLDIFEELFTQDHETKVRCVEGIPKTARMTNSYYDGTRQTIVLVYIDDSFPMVPEGGVIPMRIAAFENVD